MAKNVNSFLFPESDELLSKNNTDSHLSDMEREPKLFRRRWFMLAIVTLLTAENLTQWLFYSAIDNIVEYHFGVSSFLAQCLSLNNLAVIMFFGLPCIGIVNKTDLKVSCLISGFLSLVALWIKFFGASSGGFHLTVVGQILASFGTCFILSLPAQVASTWFGIFERSLATSIAASGLSFGMGAAYISSVQFVPDSKDHKQIQYGLQQSILIQAIICATTVLATVFIFEKKPPEPPSRSQAAVANSRVHKMTFLESLKLLLENGSYILVAVAFGVISGVLYSFFSLLNEIVLFRFPGEENLMGWMGFFGATIGILGMALAGVWLDKTKTYKISFLVCAALIALTTLGFTLAVHFTSSPAWLIFILVGLFGFLTSAFTTMGFVLGGELTYPVPEVFSTGILLITGQLFGVILLSISSSTIKVLSVDFVNWLLTGACFVAVVFIPFVKADFKRLAKDVIEY